MPRYIDADALLRNTIYNPRHVPYIAESDIIFAPTADVVEVVRCKDCCHNEGSLSEPWCRIYECRKSNNGFCNEGERKETEDGVH